MTDLKKILDNFTKLDNVKGAVLLDGGGYIVDQSFRDDDFDSQPLALLVSRAVQVGVALVSELGKMPLSQQYLEFADVQITAEQLANDCILVILAENGANLGRVRLEIRKNKGAVEAML